MEYLIIGVVSFFNLVILKIKIEKKRYFDFLIDISTLALLTTYLGSTLGGMITAMIASGLMSTYLLFTKPRFRI